MIVSSLEQSAAWAPFLGHRIWAKSIEWIRTHAATAEVGKYELGEPGWFVAVDAYSTKPESECQWENHSKTIDLQYMMEGEEGILVLPVGCLGDPVLVKEASDTAKFAPAKIEAGRVVLRPGDFVIFMPGEAHCPRVAVDKPAPLRKLVVKIPLALIQG